MEKRCKRCELTFECISENISECHCNTIPLSETTLQYLKKTTYDCLCPTCLVEIEKYSELKKTYPFPSNPHEFVEGIHYYIEGRYWVFTNYYHYLKGSCCKNNCRHCAYGYRN